MTAVVLADKHSISSYWERGSIILNRPTGATVNLGDVVYMDANNLVQPAIGNSAVIKSQSLGVVSGVPNQFAETSVPTGSYCAVTIRGPVFGIIGTPALSSGQQLYVSKTVAGGLDTTAPSGGAYDFVVGNMIDATTLFVDPGQSAPASV